MIHAFSKQIGLVMILEIGFAFASDGLRIALVEAEKSADVTSEKSAEDFPEGYSKPALSDKIKDEKLRKHLFENIDIFGKTEMPAIYILAPGIEEYEGFLLTRDFSADPFFMQNIDREEFEMKTYMKEFSDELDENKLKKAAAR